MASYYKIIVAYDGTDYHGWQQQKSYATIVSTLQETFQKTFHLSVSILGASRTDAGVHARGQVARCRTDLVIDPDRLVYAWNSNLPDSILIISAQLVDSSYNPHNDVKQKTYYYYFSSDKKIPFTARYAWRYGKNIDINKLYEALQCFVGTHDFRSFATGKDEVFTKGTVRTIFSADVEWDEYKQLYKIIFVGHSFLHHMVRRMVGAALKVASSCVSCQVIIKALAAKNPEQTLPNAPAKGLLLYKIEYEQKDNNDTERGSSND